MLRRECRLLSRYPLFRWNRECCQHFLGELRALDAVRRRTGVPCLESRLSESSDLFIDLVHLNQAGNERLAEDEATLLATAGLLPAR